MWTLYDKYLKRQTQKPTKLRDSEFRDDRNLSSLSRFAVGTKVRVFASNSHSQYFKYSGQIGTVNADYGHPKLEIGESALEYKFVQFLIDIPVEKQLWHGGTKTVIEQQLVQISQRTGGVKFLTFEEYLVHEVMES
jgi:hypothetical protein